MGRHKKIQPPPPPPPPQDPLLPWKVSIRKRGPTLEGGLFIALSTLDRVGQLTPLHCLSLCQAYMELRIDELASKTSKKEDKQND
jgi:hypothetical protein